MVKLKETELAKYLIEYLKKKGYDYYQEVKVLDKVCDVVIKLPDNKVWCIEIKVSPSLRLLEQAIYLSQYAHFVSIFTAFYNFTIREICKKCGFGYFYGTEINEMPKPLENQQAYAEPILKRLNNAQKDFCPAGSKSGPWSPYKNTLIQLEKYVKEHPGCTVKDIVASVPHHYQSDLSFKALIYNGVTWSSIPFPIIRSKEKPYKFFAK